MRRSSTIAWCAAFFLALAGSACTGNEQGQGPEENAADQPVVNLPVVPRPEPPLDRAGLLAAVAQAASASASGVAQDPARQLDGRQFEVRIRFGCRGPTQDFEKAWLGWSFDAERRRLRVHARPTISADDPLVSAVNPAEFEAVEGFWIPRPWLLEAVCPAAVAVAPKPEQPAAGGAPKPEQPQQPAAGAAKEGAPQAAAADPVPRWPRIGLAQYFTETDARTGRRGDRAFEAIKTLEEGQPLRSQGFNLVLSGRLRALPGGRVIGCSGQNPDSPPECIVSADFDRVWIENPDSREVVAEWGSS